MSSETASAIDAKDLSTASVEGKRRVSAKSLFADAVWDFTTEIAVEHFTYSEQVINWEFKITEEKTSLDPAFATMLMGLKELAYALLFLRRPRKYVYVSRMVRRLMHFVRFLGGGKYPIYRFQDVLKSDIKKYIKILKSRADGTGEISPYTYNVYLIYLNHLYDCKDYLSDYLRFRPTPIKSLNKITGCKYRNKNVTKAIPDEQLKCLIEVALDYIQNRSIGILKCLEEYSHFLRNTDARLIKSSDRKCRYLYEHFFPKRNDFHGVSELERELTYLRTACLIVVGFCTGMRLSELLAIECGSIVKQKGPTHEDFYWIKSLLFKTQKKNSGSPRMWMCGRLAAQAVSVMENINKLITGTNQRKHLFITWGNTIVNLKRTHRRRIKCLGGRTTHTNLKSFCAAHNIVDDIHPHRLRRSFARNIIRYSTTSILALKEHFKHWSLYMTDWYVGLDFELIRDLEAERLLLSIEAMDKICTQQVGGTGGRRWTKELERRIAEGRLPRTFRGKAGAEFRRTMIESLHTSGMLVVPCGDFTYCVFQKDRALCTSGDSPVVNRCNPFDCSCSYILPENLPFYRKRLAFFRANYNDLSEEEKGGPKGLYFRQETLKAQRVIESFEHNDQTE